MYNVSKIRMVLSLVFCCNGLISASEKNEFEWVLDKSKSFSTISHCVRTKDFLKVDINKCISTLGVQYSWLKNKNGQCGMFTHENVYVKTAEKSACKTCQLVETENIPLLKLVEGIDKLHVVLQSNSSKLDHYAKNIESKYKVVKIDKAPSKVTATSVEYNYYGQKLKPNECLYLKVPKEFKNKPVLFVNLGHTQTSSDNTGYDAEKKWDDNPGLTTVQLNQDNDHGKTNWRYWNGMSSGDYGAKFAEPGSMELEGLYEWYKNGHKDILTHTTSKKPLYTDAIRLCSIGKDPVTIGSLILKVAPEPADKYVEYNISSTNKMGDPLTAAGRSYGSRSDSIELDGWGGGSFKAHKSGLKYNNSAIEVPVTPGKKLSSFEVSIGDEKKNGKSGWGRLNVRVLKKDGSSVWLIQDENIPPKGVLLGAPESDYILQAGDKLLVEPHSHETFVMGVRVGLTNK